MRSALLWGGANFLVTQLGAFAVFLILAHTLEPAVFGVFAFALVLVDFVSVNGKYSLMDAMVIGQDFSDRAMSTALAMGLVVCTAAFVVSLAAAPVLAAAVSMPDITLVLPSLAALLIFTPAQAAMEASLAARLQLRALAVRNMAMSLIGGAAGVAVALGPAPEWALVVQRGVQAATSTALLWLATRVRFSLRFDQTIGWPMARRAASIWRNQAAASLPSRCLEAAIGARLGADPLGIYRVLGRFTEIVQQPLIAPLGNLVVPMMSRVDGLHRGDAAIGIMRLSAALCAPAFVGLALVSPDVVAVALASHHQPYAGAMQALAIVGAMAPILFFRVPILAALGRHNLLTGLLLAECALAAAVIIAVLPFGLVKAAWAMAAGAFVLAIVCLAAIKLALDAPWRRLTHALGPAYAATGAMACSVALATHALEGADPILRLALCATLGALSYVIVCFLLFRPWATEVLMSLRAHPVAPPAVALDGPDLA
jgi:PST family polysaccharide transporter